MIQITFILILTIFTFVGGKSVENIHGSEIDEELFEGDIVFDDSSNIVKNGLNGFFKKWRKSSNNVIIPYVIRRNNYSPKDIEIIESAFRRIEDVSCIQFVERSFQFDYIEIVNGRGCSSNVGRQGGKQTVTLTSSKYKQHCMHRGTVIHELLHSIGFYHMQSSTDRDNFVTINYENVVKGAEENFKKYDSSLFGTNYDLRSLMHYGAHYFSKNSKPTMEPRDTNFPLSALGQRIDMTQGDIKRLNIMYKCEM